MLFDRIPSEVEAIFRRQHRQAGGFWRKFGAMPDFHGKRVLDLGCGYGPLVADMLDRGAGFCVGIDLSKERIEAARRIAANEGRSECTAFHAGDIRDFDGDGFDLIVSKDTFEHIGDLTGVMAALVTRLKPGGRLYIGFGPLYNSPFGDHGWFGRWPWGHVLAGQRSVVARINEKTGNRFADLRELGLNGLTPADFRRHFRHPEMETESLVVNSVEGLAKRLAVQPMNVLRHIPALEAYFTVSIYAVLRRRQDASAGLSHGKAPEPLDGGRRSIM